MNTKTFSCGQIIFKQGDFSSSMYDILSGKVGVFADYGTDDEKQIAVFDADQTFGEMGMLEVYPRSATAVALEDDTVLAEICEDELSDYFRNKPEKLLEIMKQLSKRIRITNEKYWNACRTVYENSEAEKNGTAKSDWLSRQVDAIYASVEKSNLM